MTISCSCWGAWAEPSGITATTRVPSPARSQSATRRAAEGGEPHARFVGDERGAVHGVADGHQLVAGLVHQLVSGARPARGSAATIGDLPFAALAGGRRGKRAHVHFIPPRLVGVIRQPAPVGRERRGLIAEGALEKWLRRPSLQLPALLVQRHRPNLIGFEVRQPLAVRRERPRNRGRLPPISACGCVAPSARAWKMP